MVIYNLLRLENQQAYIEWGWRKKVEKKYFFKE